MKKLRAVLSIAILATSTSFAQTEVDAFRFSTYEIGGSARFTALGGSMGALGNDFSSLSINPAGIGTFNKNSFNFGLNFRNQSSTVNYNAHKAFSGKSSLKFGSIGIVIPFDKNEENQNFAIGIGVNNLANYQNSYVASGHNNGTSRLMSYQQQAQGLPVSQLNGYSTLLAFNTYLLDTTSSGNYYTPINSPGQDESLRIESSGGMTETVITLGGNLNEQVSMGFNLGFPSFSYNQSSNYTESNYDDTATALVNYTQRDFLSTQGDGFNMKFGVIVKPVQAVRIGLAVHSPSWFSVSDEYSSQMTANYGTNGGKLVADSELGFFDYRFTSPFRFNGSLALISSKIGFINVEYEWADYSLAKFSSSSYAFGEENERINDLFGATGSLKIGTELIFSNVALRGGYGIQGSPIKDDLSFTESNLSRRYFSAGMGMRFGQFDLDLAYLNYTGNQQSLLVYSTAATDNVANITDRIGTVSISTVYRF